MRKAMPIIGVIVGAILIVMSFAASTPDRELTSRNVPRYVGGDAYNFLMESNFRSGEIAAQQITSAIYLTGGILIVLLSLFKIADNETDDKMEHAIQQLATTLTLVPKNAIAEPVSTHEEKPQINT